MNFEIARVTCIFKTCRKRERELPLEENKSRYNSITT